MAHITDKGGDSNGITTGQRRQLDPSKPADPSEGVSGFLGNLASDASGVLSKLPRAAYEVGSAVGGDIAQIDTNIFEEVEGGDADWQLDTWNKLAEPILTESVPKTANVLSGGQIDFWKEIAEGGGLGEAMQAQKEFQEQTLRNFYEQPASFTLEHLGNVSLVSSGAGAALGKAAAGASARAGGAAARTGGITGAKKAARAQRKADLKEGKAPTTSPRRARQEVLREIEQQGGRAGSLAKASRLSSRTIGRPYSAAARKAVGTKIPGLGGRYTGTDPETGEPTPRGPLGSRGGGIGPTGTGAGAAAAGSLADMTLTGGVGGAVAGTLLSARRAGARSQSLADLTKQVRRPRSVPEGEFSPTAQRTREQIHRFMDNTPMGRKLAQSRFSQAGRGVRRTMSRTRQAMAKHRANLNARFDMGKATQRIARGIQQRYSQLADEGVNVPRRSMDTKKSTQTQLEQDPAQMGRVMDEIEQANQRRAERGEDPIDIPGTRDLDWSLTRVAQAERAQGLPEGSLQRLVTRKVQLDDLLESQDEAQRLAREAGEAQGMSPDEIDQMLRQNMSSELMQPQQGNVAWSQLDESTKDVVNRAARTWRSWQREHEAQLIQEGRIATQQGAVRMTQRRPTQRVARNTDTGDLDFNTDPDAVMRGDQQAQNLTVDEVPQYLADQHRRVQKLEQDPNATPDQVQKARADLDKAEKRWEKEEPTNDIYEPMGPDEQPPTERVSPEAGTQKKLRRKQRLIDKAERDVNRQTQLVRDKFAAHRAEALDRYNELHTEMRMREKEALNADPETAQGQQEWDTYARAYEQLNAFENELVLSGIGGRPQPMRDLAAQIEGKLSDLLYYARNSDELAPDEAALARFNEAVGELEQVQSLMPEVSPILAMIGREGLSGVSPELRALHRAARANPRLADTPEYQQALAWASNRTSRAGNAQVQGSPRHQWAANRGQSSVRRGRQALGSQGGDYFDQQIRELQDLARRYQDESRDFEQHLAQTQSQARAHLEDLARKQQKLQAARTRMKNFQDDVNQRLETAPRHYREALRFAREEAPELDRMLREDLQVPHHLVDELNLTGLPTTLEELADAGVNVSYVSTKAAEPDGFMARPTGALSATAQRRFRRAHASGDINAEDQPSIIIPKEQMDIVTRKLRDDAVSYIHQKFGRTPRQALEEAGYSRGKVDEIMEEAEGKTTYDEAGNVISRTRPQPHVLSEKMADIGFARADNAKFAKNLQRSDEAPRSDIWLKESLADIAHDALTPGKFEKTMSAIYDPVMGAWKAQVLAFRPAWQVFNFLGNNIMPIIGGGATPSQLYRYLPMAARARMRWGRGEPSDVPGLSRSRSGELFDTSTSMGEYQRDISQTATLGRNVGQAASERFSQIPMVDEAARTRPGRFVRGATSRVGGWAKQAVEGAFRFNSFFDHTYRASVYLSQLEEGANPNQAIRAAKQTLGDYTTMSPVERQVVRRSFPFYAWTRHITQLTAKQLKPSNIDRFAMQAMFIEIWGEPNEQEEMLPHYRRGDIQISEGGEDGDPSFISVGGANPFMDVTRPFVSGGRPSLRSTASLMSPLAQMGLSNMTGIRPLTQRPYSRPYERLDPQGRPIPTAPSIPDQLVDMSPQASLLRSGYRRASGETLARYGNDQPVLAEGVEEPSLLEKAGRQLFGITSGQEDVAQRAKRRQQRFERAANQRFGYQEKLKRYQQEGSDSPLRDLPLIP